MYSRRTFLGSSLAGLAVTSAVNPAWSQINGQVPARNRGIPPIQDPDVKALAHRALDAARAAGASYADVRLVHTRVRFIQGDAIDCEWITVGVRALTNGYWGFAASPIWSVDEMSRLAREAVSQAQAVHSDRARTVELTPIVDSTDGHWDMPVTIDPFTVPIGEVLDFLKGLQLYATRRVQAQGYRFSSTGGYITFVTQKKAFGSTDGRYCTQRLFRSGGTFSWFLGKLERGPTVRIRTNFFPWSGLGWEFFREQPVSQYVDPAIESAIEDFRLPVTSLDVGRYETVLDAASVAQLVHGTVGLATEADRVFGHEANATGTSYLNEPAEMLGTYRLGSPLLTIIGDRTLPGGAASVRWDDEGVAPEEFTIVKEGIVTDLATTRESAGWIQDYYRSQHKAPQSHGCALGGTDILGRGMHAPIPFMPNLTVVPGRDALTFDECVAGISKGIAFRDLQCEMDFQQAGGIASNGTAYEIRNGNRVARIGGAGILFKASELWKTLIAVGGEKSQRRLSVTTTKGEPPQSSMQSIRAVPMVFTGLSVIDILRRI